MISKMIPKNKASQSLRSYAKAIIDYISNPQNTDTKEKCILYGSKNMLNDSPNLQIDEMINAVLGTIGKNEASPLVHRVLSFHESDINTDKNKPDIIEKFMGNIPDIVEKFMFDLGYNDHQYVFGVHADTTNMHIHILSNRMDLLTGKKLQEGQGWWKNESRKACCRIEREYNLQTEANSKFIVCDKVEDFMITSNITGEVVKRTRPVIIRKPKSDKENLENKLRTGAIWEELRTGFKSKQRVMQEILSNFYTNIDIKMKFGDVYRELAKIGIECGIVKHGQSKHITFSLDGLHFEKASQVCPDFTVKNIEKLTGSGFRNPRPKLAEVATHFRKDIVKQPVEKKDSQWEKEAEKTVTKTQKIEIAESNVKIDYALIKEMHDQARLRFISKNIIKNKVVQEDVFIFESNLISEYKAKNNKNASKQIKKYKAKNSRFKSNLIKKIKVQATKSKKRLRSIVIYKHKNNLYKCKNRFESSVIKNYSTTKYSIKEILKEGNLYVRQTRSDEPTAKLYQGI